MKYTPWMYPPPWAYSQLGDRDKDDDIRKFEKSIKLYNKFLKQMEADKKGKDDKSKKGPDPALSAIQWMAFFTTLCPLIGLGYVYFLGLAVANVMQHFK